MPAQEPSANEDLKARMREALEKKQGGRRGGRPGSGSGKEKVHGPELSGGAAPKLHRRKAGGGGS